MFEGATDGEFSGGLKGIDETILVDGDFFPETVAGEGRAFEELPEDEVVAGDIETEGAKVFRKGNH